MTQILEKHFKNDIDKIEMYFIDKIQVNMYANTATAADFSLQTKKYDYLIECKQTSINKRGFYELTLNRVKQEFKLCKWEKRFKRNKSYLAFLFWKNTKLKSDLYLVPIDEWIEFRKKWDKCIIRDYEFKRKFPLFIVEYNKIHKRWMIERHIK